MVVDLYASRALSDPRLWADDRLHLNAEGHRRVAEGRPAKRPELLPYEG